MVMLTDRNGPEGHLGGTGHAASEQGPAPSRLRQPLHDIRVPADRPDTVAGPGGKPLSLAMLPSPDTKRWVVRRKAEVIAAINGGLLSAAEACARYRLSPEELELWQKAIDHAGVPGLRVTRIQLYRDDHGRRQRARMVPPPAHGTAGVVLT